MLFDMDKYMQIAIHEAHLSLREGNHGFGAVIIQNDKIISQAHDLEESAHDPTAHAELLAIQKASALLGKNLSSCRLYSTHEPCPMCATAIVWSGIKNIGYGYSIKDAIRQGRNRIDLTCNELFQRVKAQINVEEDLCRAECSSLYNQNVRLEVCKLKGATDRQLVEYNKQTAEKRIQWFKRAKCDTASIKNEQIEEAYRLLLKKLEITEKQAPVLERSNRQIVFHSMNMCPTLEACKILGIDTRKVCKLYNEGATEELLRQIDPRLHFTRNYNKLRPYTDYCEEIISLRDE
jgi:tRNA(adenine34) deaminase